IDSNDSEISVNQMIEEDNSKGTANLIVDRRRLEIVSANCLHSLRTENEGVVESAIFVSIQFKNRFPDSNDEKFVDALNELVKYSPSPVISYKAHLAKLYFESTDLFNDIDVSSILDEERVYSDISDRINRLRLSASLN
ncbi:MAG: hypothetical protein R3250_05280, partial [Melioribacteraceae bacterium]|nr:hypothetical protein [Melioribacteraceae bacterium]